MVWGTRSSGAPHASRALRLASFARADRSRGSPTRLLARDVPRLRPPGARSLHPTRLRDGRRRRRLPCRQCNQVVPQRHVSDHTASQSSSTTITTAALTRGRRQSTFEPRAGRWTIRFARGHRRRRIVPMMDSVVEGGATTQWQLRRVRLRTARTTVRLHHSKRRISQPRAERVGRLPERTRHQARPRRRAPPGPVIRRPGPSGARSRGGSSEPWSRREWCWPCTSWSPWTGCSR